MHQILTCRISSANSSPVRLLRESLLAYCQLRSTKPSVFCFFHILIGPNCTPDPPSGSRQRRPSRRNRPRRRRNRPRRRRRSRRRHRSRHHHRSRHRHQNQRLHRSLDLLRPGRGVGWVKISWPGKFSIDRHLLHLEVYAKVGMQLEYVSSLLSAKPIGCKMPLVNSQASSSSSGLCVPCRWHAAFFSRKGGKTCYKG